MNGFTFPRFGRHSHGSLNAAQNETRRPKAFLTWWVEMDFGWPMRRWRLATAMGAKLWRAVQRRRGFRSKYYDKPQESGA